jgi:hypothetical protein
MFGGMSNKISLLANKSTGGGGGSDVTCTTNFTEYVAYPSAGMQSTQQTIEGINTTITLRFDVIFADEDAFQYVKNGGSPVDLNSGDTFTVVNGDTLYFKWNNASLFLASYVEIINTSDGNTSLGTINFDSAL